MGFFPLHDVVGSNAHAQGQELPKKVKKHDSKKVDNRHNTAQETSGVPVYLEASDAKKKHRRKSQKMKDPDAPKHPKSAFIFFNSTENRQKLKDENPEMLFKDIGAKMGERWKTMPAAEREVYEKHAAEEKEKYLAAKAAYTPKVSVEGSNDTDVDMVDG
ncbi:HMG-box [Mytilinidion resinicola]|uniref:HMG-box n=1 Tax=Mytilinidion resinicola TaxID=574789 RepID=A0A6A6YPR2_9PEZI|nr:HMG-box [Mytilinidion resinicola]KAF2810770.1 HMG-box [Mytilinidion resinicola]